MFSWHKKMNEQQGMDQDQFQEIQEEELDKVIKHRQTISNLKQSEIIEFKEVKDEKEVKPKE